jgi:OmpA-OmpF porin, OOP family
MKSLVKLMVLLVFFVSAINTNAQIINPRKALGNKVVNSVNKNIDKGLDKGIDMLEKGSKEAANKAVEGSDNKTDDKSDADNNPDNNDNADAQDDNGNKSGDQQEPSLQSYSKFDFVPGEKVIFFDDFSQDAVGDFPALWNTNGSGEVVTTNLYDGHWLKFNQESYSAIWTDKFLNLPDNYTMEFDIIPLADQDPKTMAGYSIRVLKSEEERKWDGGAVPGDAGFNFYTAYYGTPNYRAYINNPENEQNDLSGDNDAFKTSQKLNKKSHISIWVQKTRIRLYLDQNKIFDLPRAASTSSRYNRFRIDDGAGLFSNFRIAVGAPDTRNKLITEGKLVSYGIYFDVNKDVVKPESYGTLKSIADVLKENPTVKIKIVGHTDADGADAANLDLSKRRGASVKNELVKTFGIDASRIETDGLGESQPVAPNDTPANKALNRRVEFIKL